MWPFAFSFHPVPFEKTLPIYCSKPFCHLRSCSTTSDWVRLKTKGRKWMVSFWPSFDPNGKVPQYLARITILRSRRHTGKEFLGRQPCKLKGELTKCYPLKPPQKCNLLGAGGWGPGLDTEKRGPVPKRKFLWWACEYVRLGSDWMDSHAYSNLTHVFPEWNKGPQNHLLGKVLLISQSS